MFKSVDFEKIVYYSVLIFSFLIPLSRGAISFFIFWFFLLLLYKRDFITTFKTLKHKAIFSYIAIFLLYMFITLLWSEDVKEGINQARLYSYWLLVLPPMAVLVKKEWLWSMLNAFLLGMFVSEILAYGIFFDFWSINGRDSLYPTPFMTHIHYSIFLAFSTILLLSRVLSNKLLFYVKLPYILFFIVSTTNLMFSTGRIGQLAFFISLFILVFLKYRVSLKSVFFSIAAVVIIFFTAYNNLDIFNKRIDAGVKDISAITNENYNSSFGIRVIFWLIAGEVLKEKPIFGNGIGDFIVSTKDILSKNDYGLSNESVKFIAEQHFHNQYLMVAVQGGVVALVLMFLLFYKLFRLDIEDRELKEISILGFSIIMISFIAEPLWMLQFPLTLFLFITAISIIASRKESI